VNSRTEVPVVILPPKMRAEPAPTLTMAVPLPALLKVLLRFNVNVPLVIVMGEFESNDIPKVASLMVTFPVDVRLAIAMA